jgi:alkanesulfonate monooxygenase SsuD/methylene tetrahydromethanopterin reductase-like flavin-dependent oxidoreductase (luciferase family)
MLEFGLHLTNQHPTTADLARNTSEQISLLHQVRDAGWHSVWVAQHYLSHGVAMLQPIPWLARLVPESGEMRLGLGIHLLALQNPLAAAEEVASLDVLSGGRLIYGAGLGYRDIEYDGLGAWGAQRVERFEQNLAVLTRLWSGEEVDVDLPWCRIEGQRLELLPLQRPHPPIWLAANSDGAVRRAARLADAWLVNPHADLATVTRQLALHAEERERRGRPAVSDVPLIREVICASTREEAGEAGLRWLGEKYQQYTAWGQDKVMPGEESFRIPFEELSLQRFLVGTPEDCTTQLQAWCDLGVTHIVFRVHWSGMPVDIARQTLRLLSDEVLPALVPRTGATGRSR